MDVLLKVISQQWIFILLAGLLIALLYFVKSKRPEDFQKIALIELVATVAALVLFALFGFQDLFLLAPVILICCELFGYIISGKVVGVLLVDFLLIQLLWFLESKAIINTTLSQILFYALQLVAAVAVGLLIDNYIRALNKAKKDKLAAAKEQETLQNKKLERHVDDLISKYGNDEESTSEESAKEDSAELDDELGNISDILKKYSLDDDEN
ncbi:MAG: hypothetical protein ACI4F6_07740 [Acutalibacteraceae bacterium]